MASKQELQRARKIVELFNEGAKVFNPGGYSATLQEVGDDEYDIDIHDAEGDFVDTFSAVTEFTKWIEDEESGYVD